MLEDGQVFREGFLCLVDFVARPLECCCKTPQDLRLGLQFCLFPDSSRRRAALRSQTSSYSPGDIAGFLDGLRSSLGDKVPRSIDEQLQFDLHVDQGTGSGPVEYLQATFAHWRWGSDMTGADFRDGGDK